MNKLTILLFLFISVFGFAQEAKIEYKEYSYTELFKMIEAEKDTIFKLSNAQVSFEPTTDSLFYIKKGNTGVYSSMGSSFRKDTLHIKKALEFRNVEFQVRDFNKKNLMWVGFSKIKFHKSVTFINPRGLVISECKFEDNFGEIQQNAASEYSKGFKYSKRIFIYNSEFTGRELVLVTSQSGNVGLDFINNTVDVKDFFIQNFSTSSITINSNHLMAEDFVIYNEIPYDEDKPSYEMLNNIFESSHPTFSLNTSSLSSIEIAKNVWKSKSLTLDIDDFSNQITWLKWDQFNGKTINGKMFSKWMLPEGLNPFDRKGFIPDRKQILGNIKSIKTDKNVKHYTKIVRIQDEDVYNAEQAMKGKFYDFYKGRHEISSANAVYIEIKDLETERLAYLYTINPTFKTFFKWRINQFLKVFSGYGTEPERAVIFSMYVIFLFAFIYLLFPNSWDAHGRKRIMNRYAFFFTYMNKKSGIHEVYLDNQKEDLLEFDEFKTLVEKQGKTVPKFFTTTALPLYKWAISGTKFSANILKRVDIMKGTWSDLPKSKRIWKSILLIGAFLIAIIYDLFIKILNALMLSINTFTTLGFGEIPIKGLPRYLAIIQGFIGWFMLTIFSVSLISQLLN